jgi:hypothetical protein
MVTNQGAATMKQIKSTVLVSIHGLLTVSSAVILNYKALNEKSTMVKLAAATDRHSTDI